MLGPTYLYDVIYSVLSLEATFLVVSSIVRLFMRMLMASFLSIPSLPINKLYVFLPTPTPLAFLRGGSACTQANYFHTRARRSLR